MNEVASRPTTGLQHSCWDGHTLLEAFRSAARWLEQHAEAVNALNVFPVPDGDTGVNMSLTLNSALAEVEPDRSCAVVADRVRYWATMRGRGNSGIILSQVLRGMAQGLAGHECMGPHELAAALVQASATAYKAVMAPIEGTMLTVVREASEAATATAATGADLEATLAAATEGAYQSVQRTPQLLKTLRDAGVVDAGGQGLFLILEGLLRYARGDTRVEEEAAPARAVPTIAFEDVHGPDDFGYCTNFVIQGQDLPYEDIRATLAAMGQSVAVVGDSSLIKVHIHLLRPGDALNYAVSFGQVSQIEITNMDLQRAALHAEAQRAPSTETARDTAAHDEPVSQVGVVAVATGTGFTAIFRSLNVGAVVDGGQTMNPSTADLLNAIEQVPQQDVVVLPNNRNVLMAARQAAQLSAKRVEVLPTKTLPQGIAAMLGFNYQADLDAAAGAMLMAMQRVRTGEVTTAVRDATIDGVTVRAGQTIGLLDGELVGASDAPEQLIRDLLDQMNLEQHEIVSVYYGGSRTRADADALAEQIRSAFPDLEVEVQEGGQSLYDYIVAAE